jgi:hypothetical protein
MPTGRHISTRNFTIARLSSSSTVLIWHSFPTPNMNDWKNCMKQAGSTLKSRKRKGTHTDTTSTTNRVTTSRPKTGNFTGKSTTRRMGNLSRENISIRPLEDIFIVFPRDYGCECTTHYVRGALRVKYVYRCCKLHGRVLCY